MKLQSEMALRVYRQVFLGIDKPIGYALEEEDENGRYKPVTIPEGIPWYVRHHDDRLPDWFIPKLVDEAWQIHVRGVSLASCRQLTDEGFAPLAKLTHLEILDLFNTNLGDAALEKLTCLKNLTSLNLAGTLITDAGVAAIKEFPKLEKLHLGWTEITDAALVHIKEMRNLRVLELRNTKVTDAGMKHVAEMTWLDTLGLQETIIGDAGVANLKPLNQTLVRLYLGYTNITDACLEDIKSFTKVRTMMLRATHLKRDHDPEIKKALTNLGGVDTGPGGIQEGLIR